MAQVTRKSYNYITFLELTVSVTYITDTVSCMLTEISLTIPGTRLPRVCNL